MIRYFFCRCLAQITPLLDMASVKQYPWLQACHAENGTRLFDGFFPASSPIELASDQWVRCSQVLVTCSVFFWDTARLWRGIAGICSRTELFFWTWQTLANPMIHQSQFYRAYCWVYHNELWHMTFPNLKHLFTTAIFLSGWVSSSPGGHGKGATISHCEITRYTILHCEFITLYNFTWWNYLTISHCEITLQSRIVKLPFLTSVK